MTDKELLEQAARAASVYELDWDYNFQAARNPFPETGNAFWNPLRDDGDAFRLAVKLFITVTHDMGLDTVIAEFPNRPAVVEYAIQDSCAAARRAIVRAAAAIGESDADD